MNGMCLGLCFNHLLRFLIGLLLECIYLQTTFIFLLFEEKLKKGEIVISFNDFKGDNCSSQSVLFFAVKTWKTKTLQHPSLVLAACVDLCYILPFIFFSIFTED
jgi:hypothetical protein